MIDKDVFKNQIKSFIVEGKKYLFIEKTMSRKETILKKMTPRYHEDMFRSGEMKKRKTHLGNDYKNGDIILFAFLQEPGDNPGIMNLNFITLTEKEFDKYEVAFEDDVRGFHQLRLIQDFS